MSQAAPTVPHPVDVETSLISIRANIETLLLVGEAYGQTGTSEVITYLADLLKKHVTDLSADLGFPWMPSENG